MSSYWAWWDVEPRAASYRLSGYTSPPPSRNSPDLARRLESCCVPGSSAEPEWHLTTPGTGVDWEKLSDLDVCTGFIILTSPTKVPSGNLGRIGKTRDINYNSLSLMALRGQARRFTH